MSTPLKMGSLEWSLLLSLSVLWGGSFLFISITVQELPIFTIVFLRVAIGALILNVFLIGRNQRLVINKSTIPAFLLLGLLANALPFSLIAWGQQYISSGQASILNATTPLFTVLVAHFSTTDEKLSSNRLLGVVIGFIGVATMVGITAFQGFQQDILAQLSCLTATLAYAFAAVYGRKFGRFGYSPMTLATGQVTASACLIAPLAIVIDHPWELHNPSLVAWLSIIGLGFLSTAIAYILYFRIMTTAGATNLGLVTFLIPITAILFGVTLLDERLESHHFFGMLIIGVGLAIIDGRPFLALRRTLAIKL